MLRFIERMMHYDFCPKLNPYVLWFKHPLGWLSFAVGASLLLGVCVSSQALVVAVALSAQVLMGCAWPWISTFGIRGVLRFKQQRSQEGDVVALKLELTNHLPLPAWGMVIRGDELLTCTENANDQRVALSRVPAISRSDFEWRSGMLSRGVYPRIPLQLSTQFPFGIWTSRRDISVAGKLIVWPRIVKLTDLPQVDSNADRGIGTSSELIGDEDEWTGVRPYRPGDSLRQVHWAQTACRDSLVVFDRQARCQQSVSIWLDEQAASVASKEECDWMIRLVASISHHFLGHAWSVKVCLGDEWISLQSNESSHRTAWMDRLAAWNPRSECKADRKLIETRGLCFAISTLGGHQERAWSGSLPAGSSWRWMLVHSSLRGGNRKPLIPADCAALIDVDSMAEQQLRNQWQRACQASHRMRSKVGR